MVGDALSIHFFLILMLSAWFRNLERIVCIDKDFGDAFVACQNGVVGKFYSLDGLLFCESKLCVPKTSLRELLIGYFITCKTLVILQEHFFGKK